MPIKWIISVFSLKQRLNWQAKNAELFINNEINKHTKAHKSDYFTCNSSSLGMDFILYYIM